MEDVSHADLIERIHLFVAALTESEIGDDDDFFRLGLVNSLRALEIVVYVETTFGVSVEDLDLDNFRTIERIALFVAGKQPVKG